jgi:hypothetical protein
MHFLDSDDVGLVVAGGGGAAAEGADVGARDAPGDVGRALITAPPR